MALPDEKVSQNTVIVSIWFWHYKLFAADSRSGPGHRRGSLRNYGLVQIV